MRTSGSNRSTVLRPQPPPNLRFLFRSSPTYTAGADGAPAAALDRSHAAARRGVVGRAALARKLRTRGFHRRRVRRSAGQIKHTRPSFDHSPVPASLRCVRTRKPPHVAPSKQGRLEESSRPHPTRRRSLRVRSFRASQRSAADDFSLRRRVGPIQGRRRCSVVS